MIRTQGTERYFAETGSTYRSTIRVADPRGTSPRSSSGVVMGRQDRVDQESVELVGLFPLGKVGRLLEP
jgi:hypothetical protein